MDKQAIQNLIKAALEVRERAYCKYSGFAVGAALKADDKVISGCNVENASYGGTVCAERAAFCTAIGEGYNDFSAIAVAGGTQGNVPADYCPPCGICRQFMTEFCDKDFKIIVAKSLTEYKIFTLGELLPESFLLQNIKKP